MITRSWITLYLICLLLGTSCAAASSMVGNAAPEFQLRDQDDQLIKLSDYHGKQSLVLVFYYAGT